MRRGAPPSTRRTWGVTRYGASSSTGPEGIDQYLDMSPAELADLGCFEFARDREVIIAGKAQFTERQLQALRQRAKECTGSLDPRLIGDALGVTGGDDGVIPDADLSPGNIAREAVEGALGASGLLGGVADVIGNALLALAGLGLVVVGITRVFGVSVGPLRGR